MDDAKVLIKFQGDTKDFDSKAKKVNVSMGSVAKGVLVATGVTKALGMAWNMVSNSMDGAIKRVDTMNNFPKVMSNLGIGAKDAQKAIDTLSDKLQGLPTSLDSATMSVQRLTSKNGDVQRSTKMFLAMNNAILAGGASSEIQASAVEQLSQAYAKGKPDMMEWRTMLSAMPAQLKQVAVAMGYVDSDALGSALRDGSVSMDEFMSKIIEMNESGIAGFKSFDEQARNATGGIQTSITNMKTAVTRGVANVINALDQGLKDAGLGGLGQVISDIGKIMENVLKKIGKGLQLAIPKIISIAKWIKKNKDWITELGLAVTTFVVAFSAVQKVIAIIKGVKTAFMLLNLVMVANPIAVIIGLISALVVAFIYCWKHSEKFRNFFIGIWDGIKKAVSTSIKFIVDKFNAIVDFFKNNWKGILLFIVNPFAGAFKLLYDNNEKFRTKINELVTSIKNFFASIPQKVSEVIESIKNFISNIPYYIGYVIGWVIARTIKFFTEDIPNAWNAFVGWVSSLPEKISTWLSNLNESFSKWFQNTKTKAINWAKQTINNVITWFVTLPNRLMTQIRYINIKFRQWYATTKANLKAKIQQLVNNIVNWFKNLPSRMVEIGTNIVNGVWRGIQNAKAHFKQKVHDFFKGIVDGAKKALGIHSPSKEFAIIGKFSVLGYTEQLEKMQKVVQQKVGETFGLSPQVTNTSALNYSPNVVVNNSISMKQDPLGQMVSNIKTFSGGAKNDYNYGASL